MGHERDLEGSKLSLRILFLFLWNSITVRTWTWSDPGRQDLQVGTRRPAAIHLLSTGQVILLLIPFNPFPLEREFGILH